MPPQIVKFSINKPAIISGTSAKLSWEVENAYKVKIDNGIGDVAIKGSISICPSQNTIYKLTASGYGENAIQEIIIRIFPTPIIESLKVPIPDFESRINLNPILISLPKIDASINMPEFNFNPPQFTKLSINLGKIKPKYKPKVSIFNFAKIYEYVRRKSGV
jgi:hypothetical protein